MALNEIFSSFQKHIDSEQDLREEIRVIVRNIEQAAREIFTVLQGIHQPDSLQTIPDLCLKGRQLFENVGNLYSQLKAKVPKEEYYRFHDHWRFSTQRLVFLAALIIYLENERLITKDEAVKFLGIESDRNEGFHLDLDDYLMGLLSLSDELVRFSVNCVTSGDYQRPVRIAKFITELHAGFRLLNLKNDFLRKRFDALKYDLKKAEEVVYDITIRGLNKPKESV